MCECCNQYQCLGSDTGVFHVGELCDLLRAENMYDVCALALRPELGYVDHMVIASGISKRHLRAVAMKINQVVSAAFIRVRVTASILHKRLRGFVLAHSCVFSTKENDRPETNLHCIWRATLTESLTSGWLSTWVSCRKSTILY